MSEPARYLNGKPENLAAAAWDALEWLRLLANPQNRRLHQALSPDARVKAALCRDALEGFVAPHLPAEYVTCSGELAHVEDELREIFAGEAP